MTVIYADTSALLKRVIIEPESAGVTRYLRERNAAGDVIAASSLAWLEVWRSLRRLGAPFAPATETRGSEPQGSDPQGSEPQGSDPQGSDPQAIDAAAMSALSGIVEIPLTAAVLVQARRIGPSMLRSSDAIHLTSAINVGASIILTHDDRLADAASLLGLEVVRPLT